jgi:signal transduction histidine kinase
LQVLLGALEVDLGVAWLLGPDEQQLLPAVVDLRTSSPPLRAFVDAIRHQRLAPGVGLPGRVWRARKPAWVPDISHAPLSARRELAGKSGLHSALAFPLQSGNEFFGVLEFFALRPLLEDQTLLNMMAAIGSEIGQFAQRCRAEEALHRAHDELELRVEQRTAELQTAHARLKTAVQDRKHLEQELLEITERERRRIGLDLHDDLGQKLTGIALMTKGLHLKLAKVQAEEAREAAKIHGLVQEAMSHASDLAHDLATLDVTKTSLPAALEHLAGRASKLFEIGCRFKADGPRPALDSLHVAQLSKIAQEAVTNAIKHGKATKVAIELASHPHQLVLTIQNNGLPFPDLRARPTGMGLRIMNYRASLLGATLEIKGLEHGALVTCSLPLEKKA